MVKIVTQQAFMSPLFLILYVTLYLEGIALSDYEPEIDITIGYVVEEIIEDFIKNKIDIDIDTVCRYRDFSKIQVLVFSLRKQRIADINMMEE